MIDRFLHTFTKFRTSLIISIFILLGGTSQEVYELKIIVYGLCTLVICWVIQKISVREIYSTYPMILSLITVYVTYSLIQIIPLPQELWLSLPNREFIKEGYNLLDETRPSLPIAISPSSVIHSLLAILPALTIFLLVGFIASDTERHLAFWTVPFLGTVSLILGFAQVMSKSEYLLFYDIISPDSEIGIFTNINHQATLTAVSLCFILFNTLNFSVTHRSFFNVRVYIGLPFIALLVCGLLAYSSVAGYIFIPIILIAFIGWGIYLRAYKFKSAFTFIFFLIFAIFIAFIYEYLDGSFTLFTSSSPTARSTIFLRGMDITIDSWPFGTGLGTFSDIYPHYENINEVTTTYVPHLHNDYLEFILEMGIIGVVLLMGSLWGIMRRANVILTKSKNTSNYSTPALFGLLIILVHSIVDYPLRTITIITICSLSLALIEVEYKRILTSHLTSND